MEGNQRELAPIDVVAIGYPPDAPMTGEAIPIVLDLVERGMIRVLDARFVKKDRDGTYVDVDFADLDAGTVGDLTAFVGASTGLLTGDDVEAVAAEVEPGGAAVMIVYENSWAAPFVDAVRRNGGTLIASQRVHVEDLVEVLDAAETAA